MGTTVSTVRYPNVNHVNLGKNCIKMENTKIRGSLKPMKVFRREIEQEATYGEMLVQVLLKKKKII